MPYPFKQKCSQLLAASAALALCVVPPATAAEAGDIVLRIGGPAGTAFSADCEVKKPGGTEVFTVEQSVPYEATYSGGGLSCRITAEGTIDVEVVKGGSSSRISTSGGSVNVNVGS
ncbi:MAG: hypothetical protein RH942_16555 [Kiloniellaceae bacterium]